MSQPPEIHSSGYSVTTRIALPFRQAQALTRQALQAEQLTVISELDLQAQLAKELNQSIRPYLILGVWVPVWELQALRQEPDIGLLMPSHVCLWENPDGTCTLATADLTRLCQPTDNPPLAEAARAINARLRAVVDEVQFVALTEGTARHSVSSPVGKGGPPCPN